MKRYKARRLARRRAQINRVANALLIVSFVAMLFATGDLAPVSQIITGFIISSVSGLLSWVLKSMIERFEEIQPLDKWLNQ